MMGRKAETLAPIKISKMFFPGLHFVGHVPGLALNVSRTGARSWILRTVVGGKRRDIGLGSYSEVPLALAKELATKKRQMIKDGIDPVAARKAVQSALKAEQEAFLTFEQAAEKYMSAHKASWKNQKHINQWASTLQSYVYPVIGQLHVKDVTLIHILKILEPIWSEKTETASRLRGRIEVILDWAKARGLRAGDNPAQWKGNLAALLPTPGKIATVKHYEAMEWQNCPGFMKRLQSLKSDSARALQLCILTACRSGEVRGARWSEIDLERSVWTIPAERMKAGKEHRIPLSEPAKALLKSLKKNETDYLFVSSRCNPLTDMALTMVLRRMKEKITVHGFRSSFRDWAGETTHFPREVIEHALAHRLKDKAEAAYARGDLFNKRKDLMKAWAYYLTV